MATIYQRPRSPFWWIRYRDPATGRQCRESTRYRVGVGRDTRAARELAAERTLAEVRNRGFLRSQFFAAWVLDWLRSKYRDRTQERYLLAWRNLSTFLNERKLAHPRQIVRQHAYDYLQWRKSNHNTARTELGIFRIVMQEALNRGFCETNTLGRLNIPLGTVREKAELTDADFAFLESEIAKEPEPRRTFLLHSYLIARYQGCRLSETHINPRTDVDLVHGTIRVRQKGNRVHVAPLHPALAPLFKRLQEAGATETYVLPKYHASAVWFNFFRRIGWKPGPKCFHSLRVTVATRLARSPKVKELDAMRYLGHASTTVHRVYVRLRTEDLRACVDALSDTPPTSPPAP